MIKQSENDQTLILFKTLVLNHRNQVLKAIRTGNTDAINRLVPDLIETRFDTIYQLLVRGKTQDTSMLVQTATSNLKTAIAYTTR
jgi:hypothetical protein